MKNKSLLLIIILSLACFYNAKSQTLTPSVISSSGGFYSSSNASLSFTVAEMTMVQTLYSANNFLTQGFQQPEDFAEGISEHQVFSGDFIAYPNPTSGKFTLSFSGDNNSEVSIKIYNLLGQVILTKTISQSVGNNSIVFDISNNSDGIYMLEFIYVNKSGEKVKSYQKINLVY